MRCYSRTPISYSALDSVGHCFQVNWATRGRPLVKWRKHHLLLLKCFSFCLQKVSEQPSRKRAGTTDSIQNTEHSILNNKDYPVYVKICPPLVDHLILNITENQILKSMMQMSNSIGVFESFLFKSLH